MMFRAGEWGLRERGSNPCLGIVKNPRKKLARFLDADELGRLGRARRPRGAMARGSRRDPAVGAYQIPPKRSARSPRARHRRRCDHCEGDGGMSQYPKNGISDEDHIQTVLWWGIFHQPVYGGMTIRNRTLPEQIADLSVPDWLEQSIYGLISSEAHRPPHRVHGPRPHCRERYAGGIDGETE